MVSQGPRVASDICEEPLWPVLEARRTTRLMWFCWYFRELAQLIVGEMGPTSSPTRAGLSWEIRNCVVRDGLQLLDVKVIKGPSCGTSRYSSESFVYFSNGWGAAVSLERVAWNVDSALWSMVHDTCPIRNPSKRQVLRAQETIMPDQSTPRPGASDQLSRHAHSVVRLE